MSAKRFLLLSLVSTLVLLSLPALLVIVADPYQVFHKPIARPDRFYNNDRYQDAGLINSWLNAKDSRYEGIVIGTSMSQNFRMPQLSAAQGLGGALKLTLSGGRARELAAIANKALAGGRIKFVLWEIYTGYFGENSRQLHPESPLPLYLYEGSLLDTWRYVLNSDIVSTSRKVYRRLKAGDSASLENHYAWSNEKEFTAWSSPAHLDTLRREVLATKPLEPAPSGPARTVYPNIDQNLLPILKAHPEVQFRLFFPPASYVTLLTSGNQGFWMRMRLRRYLVAATSKLANVSISAFDLVDGIGNTATVFKDSTHYRPWVNDFIARSVSDKQFRLRPANFSTYVQSLRTRLNHYRQAVVSGGSL